MTENTNNHDVIERVLIREPNWVGDNIFTLPAVRELRRRYPRAHLAVMTRLSIAPLWNLIGEVDEVIPFDFGEGWRGWRAKRDLVRTLRKKRFDLAVVFPRSFASAWLVFRARIPRRWGYRADLRSLLLTRRPACPDGYRRIHRADYYYRLLKGVSASASAPPVRIEITPRLRERALSIVRGEDAGIDEGRLVGFHPWASYGPAKCWPADRFASLGKMLVEKMKMRVMIFGGPSDRGPADRLARAIGAGVINLAGKSELDELGGLISLCRGFVANDSGPLHLAAAIGIPVIGLFGSSNPAATAPRGENVRTIFKNIPCSPCLKAVCPSDFQCMISITPEDVYSQLEQMM